MDELFEEEFELELLDEFELEFDELLPATMIAPSLRLTFTAGACSISAAAGDGCFAYAAVLVAAKLASKADASFQDLIITGSLSRQISHC